MSKPCLHCEIMELIRRFILSHVEYPKTEVLTDLMQANSEFLGICLETGVDLSGIPGLQVIDASTMKPVDIQAMFDKGKLN